MISMSERKPSFGVVIAFLCAFLLSGCATPTTMRTGPSHGSLSFYVSSDQEKPTTYLAEYLMLQEYDSEFVYDNMRKGIRFAPPPLDLLYTEYGKDWTGRKLGKKTRSFRTAYPENSMPRHYVVMYQIRNGQMEEAGEEWIIRPGRLTLRLPTASDFFVIYRNAMGEETGRHSIPDPMRIRSCGYPQGDRSRDVMLQSGRVEIRVPYDPAIASIELRPISQQ